VTYIYLDLTLQVHNPSTGFLDHHATHIGVYQPSRSLNDQIIVLLPLVTVNNKTNMVFS